MSIQAKSVKEYKVFMNEKEADLILARLQQIVVENTSDKRILEQEWLYLYDLEFEDSVIGFVADNRQVDVVQTEDGYAFNFWKNNHFHGQLLDVAFASFV